MMKKSKRFLWPVTVALVAVTPLAHAQPAMEEVVVQARLLSGAEALINERMDDDVVSDQIGADFISRVGDSTVAAALQRVSGLSLVGNKFVYVRGLGERYSSASLNGATIPSPDLTRNVIPLDIFPTSIVSSLSVQKGYSPEKPATFGGGSIDIRTKGIPDAFTWELEVSTGTNSETDGNLLTYAGGGDDDLGQDDGLRALPESLLASVNQFRGDLNPQNIVNLTNLQNNSAITLADAQALNRQIALSLNRNIAITSTSDDPDIGFKGSVGNNWVLTDNWEFGFLVGGAYSDSWRKTESVARNFTFPDQRQEREVETTRSVNLNGNLNLGIRFGDDHEIASTSLYIRNTDDEVARIDFWNENREIQDGTGFRNERIKFEERTMIANQVKGTHYLGEGTREQVPGWLSWIPLNWVPEETQIDWYYSDSKAYTDIPNEVQVQSGTSNDPVTGQVLTSNVRTLTNVADYRFTTLDDDVLNYAGSVTLPIETASSSIEFSGGAEYTRKLRLYRQSQFGLGMFSVADQSILSGSLSEVFSDANITDTSNDFVINLTGTNTQSYIAITETKAAYGKVDWTFNDTWRVAAGARRESYRQIALDWDLYAYDINSPQVTVDPDIILNGTFKSDEWYPSVAVTYMGDWWAEVFQLRFGWSETVVRPDLREITDASYVDARTGFVTSGNSSVVPSDITNLDVRAEWFFSGGDNLTVSAYFKDIENPIEFFEQAASDTVRAREIVNAASAEVTGMEIEGLKGLGFLGEFWEAFFVQGNVTIQESELDAGTRADAPTNQIRELSGASDYVVNGLIGFDSMDAKHSATLSYNVFGERVFSAGRLGSPDSIEQPFNSLDITYSWYPTDAITLKLKVQNILDETLELQQGGVTVFEEKPGTGVSLSFRWAM